jgi:IclR family transcriptional regulator, acetate operon repressor
MAIPKDRAGSARKQRGRPRSTDDRTQQNTLKSLDRALVVLAELARMESATLSGLAQSLGESPATVYRILATLQEHGMVESDETAQSWHIGAGAFQIGSVFLRRTSLIERSRAVLRRLMETTGETANLGVESEGAVLFVSQVETHASIRAFFPPGTKSPLHASGIGKALLAHFSPERGEQVLARGLQSFTPHTITDADRLRSDLAAIRERGYAIDDEERTEGMRCVAAPICNAHGETIAGISVSGPVSRVTPESVEAFAAEVIEAGRAISAALGMIAIPRPTS